uniref:Uncharacterized protein n=1 Tax=Paraburkholderia sprentiae WSM5005 TaxID=754502 RepID=A0A1I9YHA3_9BURK
MRPDSRRSFATFTATFTVTFTICYAFVGVTAAARFAAAPISGTIGATRAGRRRAAFAHSSPIDRRFQLIR